MSKVDSMSRAIIQRIRVHVTEAWNVRSDESQTAVELMSAINELYQLEDWLETKASRESEPSGSEIRGMVAATQGRSAEQ